LSNALWIGGVGLGLLVAAGALVVPLQRAALFPAPGAPETPTLPPRAESLWIESPAGRTELWWLPPFGDRPATSVILFAHGNGERIDDWGDTFSEVRTWGLGVLLVEYPGYGRSGGSPSEGAIRAVMLRAYDRLRVLPGLDRVPVIGYGRSLGGGAIGLLIAERELAALVLESTFSSVVDLARERGVPGALMWERFETLARLPRYSGPVLVVHGDRDALIPVSHARALSAAAAEAELVVFPGCGHNDCPRPWSQLQRFLLRHSLVTRSESPATGL